jgi:hypothetical protein
MPGCPCLIPAKKVGQILQLILTGQNSASAIDYQGINSIEEELYRMVWGLLSKDGNANID